MSVFEKTEREKEADAKYSHHTTADERGFTTPHTYVTTVRLDPDDPKLDEKIKVNEVMKKYLKPQYSLANLGSIIFMPAEVSGFGELSRQNLHSWYQMKSVPRFDKFLTVLICIENMELRGEDVSEYKMAKEFCLDMLFALGEDKLAERYG
jgi:hypothetical protein